MKLLNGYTNIIKMWYYALEWPVYVFTLNHTNLFTDDVMPYTCVAHEQQEHWYYTEVDYTNTK